MVAQTLASLDSLGPIDSGVSPQNPDYAITEPMDESAIYRRLQGSPKRNSWTKPAVMAAVVAVAGGSIAFGLFGHPRAPAKPAQMAAAAPAPIAAAPEPAAPTKAIEPAKASAPEHVTAKATRVAAAEPARHMAVRRVASAQRAPAPAAPAAPLPYAAAASGAGADVSATTPSPTAPAPVQAQTPAPAPSQPVTVAPAPSPAAPEVAQPATPNTP